MNPDLPRGERGVSDCEIGDRRSTLRDQQNEPRCGACDQACCRSGSAYLQYQN